MEGERNGDANEVKPHQCPYPLCSRSFNQFSNLFYHYTVHQAAHAARKKSKQTLESDAKRKRKPTLKKAEIDAAAAAAKKKRKQVQKSKPFGCPDCSKAYSTQRNLTAHVAVHQKSTGEKKNRQLKRRQGSKVRGSKLTNQQKISKKKDDATKKNKRRKCEICDKWILASNLARHRRSVHGALFKCGSCNRCFSNRIDLKKHSKTTGHRNYPKEGGESGDPEKPFKCWECDRCFISKTGRRQHFQKYH